MTTSDDEPIYADASNDFATTHADPLADGPSGDGADGAYADAAPPAAGPGAGRLVLGILAALGAALAGVALWAFVYAQMEREYVGVSVLIGLVVGWAIRTVSGRSGYGVRILAVVITALACVAGTVTGEVAYTAKVYQAQFWQLLGDVAPDWLNVLKQRQALTFAIFAAALVLAFLSASPPKEKKPKKGAATAATTAGETYYDADATLADGDPARDGDRDDDRDPPPPHLPAG